MPSGVPTFPQDVVVLPGVPVLGADKGPSWQGRTAPAKILPARFGDFLSVA